LIRVCKVCGIEKPLEEFVKHKMGFRHTCIECYNSNGRNYHRLNKDKRSLSRKLNRNLHVNRERAKATLDHHKKSGNIISITRDELELLYNAASTCKICGRKLTLEYGSGKILKSSPSLDRINNEDELRVDNIQIICNCCNATKRNRTMKEFIEYCELVIRRVKNGET
jgi:hypothetical protein